MSVWSWDAKESVKSTKAVRSPPACAEDVFSSQTDGPVAMKAGIAVLANTK